MIVKNRKNIEEIRLGERVVESIHLFGYIIYEAVRSCFGKGSWSNETCWNNQDGWINNK